MALRESILLSFKAQSEERRFYYFHEEIISFFQDFCLVPDVRGDP
jgi:hypothetical protein